MNKLADHGVASKPLKYNRPVINLFMSMIKSKITLAGFAAILLMAGCSSTPPLTRIKYPVTYQVQVGNTRVASDYGPQNLTTSANQQVSVGAGRPIYYQVVSPFDITVQVSESDSPHTKKQVGQMQGTSFTAMATPQTPVLEFSFVPTHTNTGGTLQFTLSDQPIASP